MSAPDPLSADLRAALAQWRVAHPQATLAEIERAVDQQLSASRAGLIAATAMASADERPSCPACGEPMHRASQRSLTLTTAHEGEVTLTGQTYQCPACGAGLFPPR